MRLLPLTLSAHPSAWLTGTSGGEWQGGAGTDRPRCRFCGVETTGGQEVFHRNGDHEDERPDNLVPACTLCHLTQHLDGAERSKAARLIWMPEMSQAAVITLSRGIHALLLEAGERPSAPEPPRRRLPVLAAAWRALSALRAREAAARDLLGTSSPSTLAAALLALSPTSYRERAELLDGIRLLPTGQLIRDGKDIYPDLLRQWRGPTSVEHSRSAA